MDLSGNIPAADADASTDAGGKTSRVEMSTRAEEARVISAPSVMHARSLARQGSRRRPLALAWLATQPRPDATIAERAKRQGFMQQQQQQQRSATQCSAAQRAVRRAPQQSSAAASGPRRLDGHEREAAQDDLS
ncbi:uncharacterized protein K452DRAFT_167791 [Aplosporella prunicola CBS 121167]|uniref:Uncharacterized protein n=1 Tax=Aplosporella prunicola CBS 121167 TaxID=1176127 RepID=A0A6A6BGC7_9PEZI|nr:uncharacterized protein K452DRAFT_167791 [Aplosporella prunicola CBS 121167]KAF2143230.1 hypothetical protein K452DRAFT_167791 [Aplosporella prunicola CBS 121167]